VRKKPLQTQKTVLVTGGSRGIGRGTAALLAQRGYRVAVADLDRPTGGAVAFFR
jgi:NAD(P)-dependent dehydrogenase (short-subunit alcohol dehydrogenase family)